MNRYFGVLFIFTQRKNYSRKYIDVHQAQAAVGAAGAVAALANVAAGPLAGLQRLYRAGKLEAAAQLQRRLIPFNQLLTARRCCRCPRASTQTCAQCCRKPGCCRNALSLARTLKRAQPPSTLAMKLSVCKRHL